VEDWAGLDQQVGGRREDSPGMANQAIEDEEIGNGKEVEGQLRAFHSKDPGDEDGLHFEGHPRAPEVEVDAAIKDFDAREK